jgi:hypothetical protein
MGEQAEARPVINLDGKIEFADWVQQLDVVVPDAVDATQIDGVDATRPRSPTVTLLGCWRL